jgi:hypothetical protein
MKVGLVAYVLLNWHILDIFHCTVINTNFSKPALLPASSSSIKPTLLGPLCLSSLYTCTTIVVLVSVLLFFWDRDQLLPMDQAEYYLMLSLDAGGRINFQSAVFFNQNLTIPNVSNMYQFMLQQVCTLFRTILATASNSTWNVGRLSLNTDIIFVCRIIWHHILERELTCMFREVNESFSWYVCLL